MATAIQTWQILNDKLTELSTTFSESGRKELQDLEKWLKTNSELLGNDIAIIGEQVIVASGRIDFLAVDRLGNLVIIELKRDKLSREVLAQALDYAAALSGYDQEEINEICHAFTLKEFGESKELGDYLSEKFPEVNFEDVSFNQTQRILLVGFSIDESLQRMTEWLSEKYSLPINAIALKYTKTAKGDELLSKITLIPEEVDEVNIRKRKFVIQQSREPGNYDSVTLRAKLSDYLTLPMWAAKRLREIFLPALIDKRSLTRDEMRGIFHGKGEGESVGQAGYFLAHISSQMRMKGNDFLRQIIVWDGNGNISLVDQYRADVMAVLEELKKRSIPSPP